MMRFFNIYSSKEKTDNDCLSDLSFFNGSKMSLFSNYNEEIFNFINLDETFKKCNNAQLFSLQGDKFNKNTDNNLLSLKANIPVKKTSTEVNNTNYKTNKVIKVGAIFQISKETKRKQRGRKRSGNVGGRHNKFSVDNLIRKVKSKLISAIVSFINSILKDTHLKNELYSKIFLAKIDQKYIRDTSSIFNIKLMELKIKDIFSDNISKKYLILGKNFNKNIITKIYTEQNQKNTIDIFEMTFLDCLDHVTGRKQNEKLKGLEDEFKNIVNNMNETRKYIEAFYNFMNRFEFHFKSIKPRKKKSFN